jgi:CHASE3 domain sensor protein
MTKKQLELEYTDLYKQRDEIQTRMDRIKSILTTEEYQNLVRKVENPGLARLQLPVAR